MNNGLRQLDLVKDCKVLVVGDAIMDEYVYVTTLGKSIKEPVISTRLERKESFRGGVWAAAAHLTDLCAKVDVLTGPRVMVNTRFVDPTYTRKLFTVHEERELACDTEHCLPIEDYDVVIVTDFGHGAITGELRAKLTKSARFLAVNTQTNSQNFGFNLITKYPRADFVVLDELEARLATCERDSPIEDVIRGLGHDSVLVTRGTLGVVGYDGEFYSARGVVKNVVDTMGAGDAVLAVASVFAAAGVPVAELVRIGNAAGAIKVGIVGHRQHVTRAALEEWLA